MLERGTRRLIAELALEVLRFRGRVIVAGVLLILAKGAAVSVPLVLKAIVDRNANYNRTSDWTYDLVGNRQTQFVAVGPSSSAVTTSTAYTYDANDRLPPTAEHAEVRPEVELVVVEGAGVGREHEREATRRPAPERAPGSAAPTAGHR